MLPIDFTLQDSLRAKLYKFKTEDLEQDCSVCNRKYYNNIFYKDEHNTFFKCLNCLFTSTTGTQITKDPDNFKGQIIEFVTNPNSSFGEVFKPAQGEDQNCSICKINTSWLFLNTVRNNLPICICLTCYANSTNIPYKVLPFTELQKSINVKAYHRHTLFLQEQKNKDIECSCNLSHSQNTRFKCGAWYKCQNCNYFFCLNCYILLYRPDGDNTNVIFGDCKCSLNHDENAKFAGLSFKRPLKKVSKKSPRKSRTKSARKSRTKSARKSRKSVRKSRKSSKKSVRKSRKRSKLQSK
jgi:hypothetical protein